jgi:glycosyltransferase involved in cell wall biosynthesis
MPRISAQQITCVIPYAGAVKYISEVVDSAVAQKFGEIIIINDGFPPAQLAALANQPGIRIVNLPQSIGCPKARNLGIQSSRTPYIVLLDHDDILDAGYFAAMADWLEKKQLRCAAGTLRYIGENPRRVGAIVSRDKNFFLPSGFLAEASLLAEVGGFPDSIGDDLLFFRAIRQATTLTTCPGASVLYRIHPQAESSRNTKAWWAFDRLLSRHDRGEFTLAEINVIAREFAQSGKIPAGLEAAFSDSDSAAARFLARSAYACWLNRDPLGLAKFGVRLLRHLPVALRLASQKWRRR